jgi:hypothetical protein
MWQMWIDDFLNSEITFWCLVIGCVFLIGFMLVAFIVLAIEDREYKKMLKERKDYFNY